MSAPIQIPPYERKSVSSLKDLQPGDHILVTTKNAPRQSWAAWGRNWLPRSSSSCPNAPVLPAGQQHMLVVSTETKKVRVIYMTIENGVKEENIPIDPKNITVLKYECRVPVAQAIANARMCFGEVYDQKFNNDEKFVLKANCMLLDVDQQQLCSETISQEIQCLSHLKTGDHIIEKGHIYNHHLLVVRVCSLTTVHVLHKDKNGFTEEQKSYRPSEIKVFRYKCPYDEEQIIARARKIVEKNELFHADTSNCEHFVREARTGRKESFEVQKGMKKGAVAVGVVGAVGAVGVGAVTGLAFGNVPGAFMGGALGVALGGATGGYAGKVGTGAAIKMAGGQCC